MIPIISLPSKIIKLLEANISPGEVAAGICLSMFLGFTPLNGPLAILLIICFFLFKINRLSCMLILPIFKLFYILGVSNLADFVGGVLLIKIDFLKGFWNIVTGLPLLAYLDFNYTLVTGGLVISMLLCIPVYIGSVKATILMREKYGEKIKNLKIVKFVKKLPIIKQVLGSIGRLRGGV